MMSGAWETLNQKLLPIFDFHNPVVAKEQGNYLAGGMEIALLCDTVIAAHDALIGHPGTRVLGTPPLNVLVYHLGPQWAKRLLLTGDLVTGADSARIDIVLDAVRAADLEGTPIALPVALY